jgi:hypothetical protein
MVCQRVQIGDAVVIVCGPKPREKKEFWPAERTKLTIAGYRFKYARACRLCRAQIEFWSTPEHKLIPLDRRTDERRVPHWSTCPDAAEFRKKHKIEQGELFK